MDNWRGDEWRSKPPSRAAKQSRGANAVKPVENNTSEISDADEMPKEAPAASDTKPLKNTWTMWLFEEDRNKSWEDMQSEIETVDTVGKFWKLLNQLKPPSDLKVDSDYSFFKKGITPLWETEANKEGGHWVIPVDRRSKAELNYLWTHILLSVLHENFRDHNDELCGVVIQIRNKKTQISVWTAHARNEEAVIGIGYFLRDILKPMRLEWLEYKEHKNFFFKAVKCEPTFTIDFAPPPPLF